MASHIVLLDESNDPRQLAQIRWPAGSHLLVLFWAAERTLEALRRRTDVHCHTLLDIVGGLAHWERRAGQLATGLCDAGPRLGDLPWRRLVEEPLYREALDVVAFYDAFVLTQGLWTSIGEDDGASARVELYLAPARHRLWQALAGEGPLAGQLHGAATSTELARSSEVSPSVGRRILRRARRIVTTGDVWGQAWNLLDQLDNTYRYRCGWNRRRSTPSVAAGGITFFSSYRNNSRNLRHLDAAMEEDPTWLVTNRYARLGCRGTGGEVFDLYRFAGGNPLAAPAEGSLSTASADLSRHLDARDGQGVSRATAERLLTAWLEQSPAWNYWCRRGHSALARLAGCWRHYLETAQPRLVVVGNQWSLEGWLTQWTQGYGVPVLQVHHGIASGEYYTGRPVPADALLVTGDFWRRLWPPEYREPVHVLPLVKAPSSERRPTGDLPCLTYFSWPLDRLPFYNAHELMDGFVDLLHGLATTGRCRVHVRCHPLENPADFIGHWKKRHGAMPEGTTWSQDESLDEIIAATDVALMYRSTAMLKCLAHGIPFLLPGWIDFTWRRQLEGLPGIHVGRDFKDLDTVSRAWLDDPPTPAPGQREDFLGPTLDVRAALARRFEALLRNAKGDVPMAEGAAGVHS